MARISELPATAACLAILTYACTNNVHGAIALDPSTIEAYASGNGDSGLSGSGPVVSELQQNITGSGDYSQTASAPTTLTTGSWSGYWTWTGSTWLWTWIFVSGMGQNTATYAVTVDTSNNALSIAGSASAIQAAESSYGNVFVTLDLAFDVTGNTEQASLSASMPAADSTFSLEDTTTAQTLFSSSTSFDSTTLILPADNQYLLQYSTTGTYPGSDGFVFSTVPEPASTGAVIMCGTAFLLRRRRPRACW